MPCLVAARKIRRGERVQSRGGRCDPRLNRHAARSLIGDKSAKSMLENAQCQFVVINRRSASYSTLGDLVGGPQTIGYNCQTRIDPAARREEGSVKDIEIVEVMCAIVAVEHARSWIVAEAASAAHVTAVQRTRWVAAAGRQREGQQRY